MKTALAVAALMLSGSCASAPDVRASSHECEAKYRVELPSGAVEAKPITPTRIAPQHGRRSAYACVVALIDERGQVTQSRVVETDWPPFGEYFLNLVKQWRYQPGTLNGRPFAHEVVLAASYE
jgi:hypothetical protein